MNNVFNPNIVTNVAGKIDRMRIENNYSMRELAKKSGVSISTMVDIINQKKIPNIYTLNSICNALNVSLSEFFNFDDKVISLRAKENILISIYRELSPMSQDTLIKVSKCMK